MDHLDVLCRLIEYDTSGVDGSGCHEAIRYLERLFVDSGCESVVVPIPSTEAEGLQGRLALVAHRRIPGKPRLLIYGHLDVVPAEGWDAFKPLRNDGRIFGRGASDMKGAIAALVGALWQIRDAQPEFDLTVVLTMDEETRQMAQLRYLTAALDPGPKPHVMSLDAGFGYVSVANLGLLQVDITVRGHSVHSGLAHLGRNAVECASPLLETILELKQRVVSRKATIPTHPSTGLSFMEARLNVNQINGGIARNVVPDQCTFAIDRRLLPEESIDGAREEILAALHQVRGVDWVVSREFSIPSVPPCLDPLARTLANIVRDVTGSTGLYGEMLSSELPAAAMTYWGGDAFATGVIRPDNHIHGIDEFVYASDIDQLVEVLARFLTGDPKEAA